jgi:magnesium-transporting ATPase (P-type)
MEFELALKENSIQFTFLACIGMKDNLRPKVHSVVNAVKESGHVNVRLISGDHIETARAVAYKAGILTDQDGEDAVMAASDFRQLCGKLDSDEVENDGDEG